MLMNVLDQLVDACLQFGRQPPEQQPPAFSGLVEPVYQLFQKVHEQYLENFKEYRALLNAPGTFAAKAEALCARLATDHRFSADQEAKVILFMEVSRQQITSYVREETLIGFVTGICSYLSRAFTEVCGTQYSSGTLRVTSPVFRNTLTGRLRKMTAEAALTEEGRHAAGAEVLDGIVAELQSGFAAVSKSYLALRTKTTG
jgi:hypothetical protein